MSQDPAALTAQSGLLDADTPQTVRLTVTEAHAVAALALRRLSYSDEEIAIIADQLIDNALCGYKFAGLPRILMIARNAKTAAPRQPVRVVHETAASALIDGGNNVGYLTAVRGADMAIEKSRSCGLAAVGVYNSYYSGRLAYFVERMALAGLIAIHTESSGVLKVLPPGATRPALGTNPICIGFPSADGPVVFDMGTASMQGGDVVLHALLGELLPAGIGYDAAGQPSRDPSAVIDGGVSPFGAHKGYGLSFCVQALGLLAGAALARGEVRDYGYFFFGIRPDILMQRGEFEQQMAQFVREIKATPRQPGVDEIRIPFERAVRERARRRQEGIVIERSVLDALGNL